MRLQLPPDAVDNRANGAPQRGGYGKQRNYDPAVEAQAFLGKLNDPKSMQELQKILPDNISIKLFVNTAKTAVTSNPDLLNPEFRSSLFQGIAKAAGMGLLPDGKHGALVPRWDDKARKMAVAFQPMVWGITQLGRRAGAIKKISANIVFEGEDYELLGGLDDSIHHKINPQIVDEAYTQARTPDGFNTGKFIDKIVLSYCIIVAPDGTVTWRYMTRSRIQALRAASKANRGPWNSPWADEMILKGVILFTSKHIDLDGDTPEMRRFQEALWTDMEIDFSKSAAQSGKDGAIPQLDSPALPAPSEAMERLSQQVLNGAGKDNTVQARASAQQARPTAHRQAPQSGTQPGARQQSATPRSEPTAPRSAAQPAPANGEHGARDFVSEFIKHLYAAARSSDADAAVSRLVSRPAVVARLRRLRRSYPTAYGDLVRCCLRDDVLGSLRGLETEAPELYDDIVAAMGQREAA